MVLFAGHSAISNPIPNNGRIANNRLSIIGSFAKSFKESLTVFVNCTFLICFVIVYLHTFSILITKRFGRGRWG